MEVFTHPEFDGHEQVVFSQNSRDGLKSIIAIHDTTLGPALGGCRVWAYRSEGEALTDVLRLSKGMSYKAALAGLPLGGGKSVILADPFTQKSPAMMRAMGRAVERLGGRYIIAEDVGVEVADMDEVAKETRYVSGVSGGVGDPSPWTAEGVFLALRRAVEYRLGRDLEGVRVAVSGLGHVGGGLCRWLAGAGARLVVADIRAEAVERVVAAHGAEAVGPPWPVVRCPAPSARSSTPRPFPRSGQKSSAARPTTSSPPPRTTGGSGAAASSTAPIIS